MQSLAKSADSSPKSLPIQLISSEYPLSESRSVSNSTSTISNAPNCSEQKGPSRYESPATKSAVSASIPGRGSFEESPSVAMSEQILRTSFIADPLSSIPQQPLRRSFVAEVPLASISNSVNSKSEPNSAVTMLISESADEMSLRLQLAQGFKVLVF